MDAALKRWDSGEPSKVPYWVYTDEDLYRSELDRIWYGPHWLYAGLEAELPEVGSYRTTTLGERPVIVVRSTEDEISVMENRCRHRGVQICQARFGKEESLTCPYHQWSYALDGALQGVPFRRGIKGKGGMPPDFNPKEYGLRRLKVEVVNGVVWASFDDNTPPFREYIGEKMWGYYERIFNGRRLRVIGYNRQLIPSNWKLMMENIKDPYHAALLHVFFATFGLFRPDQKSAIEMDETGRHACLMSIAPATNSGAPAGNQVAAALPGFRLVPPACRPPAYRGGQGAERRRDSRREHHLSKCRSLAAGQLHADPTARPAGARQVRADLDPFRLHGRRRGYASAPYPTRQPVRTRGPRFRGRWGGR